MAVTLSPHALTTLEDVRAWLNWTASDTSQDDLLKSLINRATGLIELKADRLLKSRAYVNDDSSFHSDGSGSDIIYLHQWPIVSVEQVVILHDTTSEVVDVAKYRIYSGRGQIRLIEPISTSQRLESMVPRGVHNVRVDYTAGYVAIPEDLAIACIEQVNHLYRRSGASEARSGVSSRSVGNKAETFVSDLLIPDSVMQVIDTYRRKDLIQHRMRPGVNEP